MKCLSALFSAAFVGLAYIVSQGNITATIMWFAITTGATARLSYYRKTIKSDSVARFFSHRS